MELSKLMVDSKAAWMDFPGLNGFSVEVAALSRKEQRALFKSCSTQKFDRKTRQVEETLDEDKFATQFTQKTIKNWKGLSLEHLSHLVLIDLGDQDPNMELEYSQDNAETLLLNSQEFDNWINEVVFDLDNFRN